VQIIPIFCTVIAAVQQRPSTQLRTPLTRTVHCFHLLNCSSHSQELFIVFISTPPFICQPF